MPWQKKIILHPASNALPQTAPCQKATCRRLPESHHALRSHRGHRGQLDAMEKSPPAAANAAAAPQGAKTYRGEEVAAVGFFQVEGIQRPAADSALQKSGMPQTSRRPPWASSRSKASSALPQTAPCKKVACRRLPEGRHALRSHRGRKAQRPSHFQILTNRYYCSVLIDTY